MYSTGMYLTDIQMYHKCCCVIVAAQGNVMQEGCAGTVETAHPYSPKTFKQWTLIAPPAKRIKMEVGCYALYYKY